MRRCALALLALASSAGAQQVVPVYPYPSPGAPPMVPLQCDPTYLNCKPYTMGSPLPSAAILPESLALVTGDSFSCSTGAVSVSAGNYGNVTFVNPTKANGGVPVELVLRRFGSTATVPLIATAQANPGTITGGTVITCKTLRTDGLGTSGAVLNYLMQSGPLSTGTAGVGDILPPTGNAEILIRRLVMPGGSFGYSIAGTGGGLTAAAQVVFTVSFINRRDVAF